MMHLKASPPRERAARARHCHVAKFPARAAHAFDTACSPCRTHRMKLKKEPWPRTSTAVQ